MQNENNENNEKKPKLQIKKSVIEKLTMEEQSNVVGGAFTTSFVKCTGILCCEEPTIIDTGAWG